MMARMARAPEGSVITKRGSAVAGSNHRTAALWNRGLVLRLLRQHKALSRRQIASITGHSESNVGVLIHTAIKNIRARMREQELS